MMQQDHIRNFSIIAHIDLVGRNSAAPFPANAENSTQAPFLPPLPTGPAPLGPGGAPIYAGFTSLPSA